MLDEGELPQVSSEEGRAVSEILEYGVVLDHASQRKMRPFLRAGDRVFQRHTAPGEPDEYLVTPVGADDPEGWQFVGQKGREIA